MDEMMVRLDDFVRSEEAFTNTELPKGKVSEASKKLAGPLRRQLESALESGKLNHLIKDARQRGRGNPKGRDRGKDKFINMIRSLVRRKKEKIHGDERKLDENTDCFPGGIDRGYPG
ncbi:hypothetical protein Tco_1273053 [Tanacetum coccineum]